MKKIYLSFIFFLVCLSSTSYSQVKVYAKTFEASNITAENMHKMLENIHSIYGKKIEKKFKKRVGYVAYAGDINGSVDIYSYETIKLSLSVPFNFRGPEALAVLCHEVGHLVAGGRKGNWINIKDTLAAEGESDYFIPSCMSRYMSKYDVSDQDLVLAEADEDTRLVCSGNTKNKFNEEQCLIILQAVKNVISIMAEDVHFDRDHDKKVKTTDRYHPDPQCRLITVKNAVIGRSRPRCWYHPLFPVIPSVYDYTFIINYVYDINVNFQRTGSPGRSLP